MAGMCFACLAAGVRGAGGKIRSAVHAGPREKVGTANR